MTGVQTCALPISLLSCNYKTFASDLIKVEVSEKNDIVVTAQKRITVDTNVVVPVKLTVTNADGTNATVYASFTVTVKAYPVQ